MRRKRECNAEPRGVDTSISSIQSGSNPLEDDLQATALLTVPLTPTQQEERGEGGGLMRGSCRSSVAGGGRRGATLAVASHMQIAQCRRTNPSHSPPLLPFFFFFSNE